MSPPKPLPRDVLDIVYNKLDSLYDQLSMKHAYKSLKDRKIGLKPYLSEILHWMEVHAFSTDGLAHTQTRGQFLPSLQGSSGSCFFNIQYAVDTNNGTVKQLYLCVPYKKINAFVKELNMIDVLSDIKTVQKITLVGHDTVEKVNMETFKELNELKKTFKHAKYEASLDSNERTKFYVDLVFNVNTSLYWNIYQAWKSLIPNDVTWELSPSMGVRLSGSLWNTDRTARENDIRLLAFERLQILVKYMNSGGVDFSV